MSQGEVDGGGGSGVEWERLKTQSSDREREVKGLQIQLETAKKEVILYCSLNQISTTLLYQSTCRYMLHVLLLHVCMVHIHSILKVNSPI